MLPQSILKKIEQTYGNKIIASGQCATLAEEICAKTKEYVCETSVQCWFGMTKDQFIASSRGRYAKSYLMFNNSKK